MQYSNAQILSAVLNKFLQPVVIQFASAKMNTLPFIQSLQNKFIASGWVSPNWNVAQELAPIIEPITSNLMEPFLKKYLSGVPDEAIPQIAHSFVDNAIANNGISLMEGRLVFDRNDMEELKKLLLYNLPIKQTEEYQVLLTPPKPKEDGTEVTTNQQPLK